MYFQTEGESSTWWFKQIFDTYLYPYFNPQVCLYLGAVSCIHHTSAFLHVDSSKGSISTLLQLWHIHEAGLLLLLFLKLFFKRHFFHYNFFWPITNLKKPFIMVNTVVWARFRKKIQSLGPKNGLMEILAIGL